MEKKKITREIWLGSEDITGFEDEIDEDGKVIKETKINDIIKRGTNFKEEMEEDLSDDESDDDIEDDPDILFDDGKDWSNVDF